MINIIIEEDTKQLLKKSRLNSRGFRDLGINQNWETHYVHNSKLWGNKKLGSILDVVMLNEVKYRYLYDSWETLLQT